MFIFYHNDMKRQLLTTCFIVYCLSVLPSTSLATTEYARQTGFQCKECHNDAMGGGALTNSGEKFLDNMKIKGIYRPMSKTQRVVRFVIGYIHLLTAIAWFGTILYVHILLKPAYAAKGLPKGELLLGWISIIIMLVTGILLSIARIPAWKVFVTTKFGVLLSIKIFLFLIMLITALIVTIFIGPRMRKKRCLVKSNDSSDCTIEGLAGFDGKEGSPAYVAYKGIIYDVTNSKLWENGSHLKKHTAGSDLTDMLKTAPHGEEKILAMPEIGNLLITGKLARPFYEKMFYFFAYMNLIIVFLIVFVVALMRWG